MTSPHTHDVIVIGAGAAGLMCAAQAGARGRKVVVLDHNDQPGAKILISGGGRCNFTNRTVTPANYLSRNPHYATSALKRYGPNDFLGLIRHHGIAWHEREHGQLFCDISASLIVDALLRECAAGRVEIRTHCRVGDITGDGPYHVSTSQAPLSAPSLVIATGGLSLPKIGATGFAHALAKRYGLGVIPTQPALVALSFAEPEIGLMSELSGIALPVETRFGKARFRDALLFTHRGLSGPAALQISSYWQQGRPITVDLLPGLDLLTHLTERKNARPNAQIDTILAEILPARLAKAMAERAGLAAKPIGQTQNAALAKLASSLKEWSPIPAGTEGYRTAEATLGGVDTADLSSKTMEAKAHPGLYFIGEAVDVTGWLGGYNFQWAWSSGWVAGQTA